MTDFPPFLRFSDVGLFYSNGLESIEEKCHFIESYIRPLKQALKDTRSIQFYGDVSQDDNSCFRDHSVLLSYLTERLLPICDSSHRYKFYIRFYSDKEASSSVISSILQMPQISRCSDLFIELNILCLPKESSIETISNWLFRKVDDGMDDVGRYPQKINLEIVLRGRINVVEMEQWTSGLAKVKSFKIL